MDRQTLATTVSVSVRCGTDDALLRIIAQSLRGTVFMSHDDNQRLR